MGRPFKGSLSTLSYFCFGFTFRLIALQAQRRDSGVPRGITCNQDSQDSQRKHPEKPLECSERLKNFDSGKRFVNELAA